MDNSIKIYSPPLGVFLKQVLIKEKIQFACIQDEIQLMNEEDFEKANEIIKSLINKHIKTPMEGIQKIVVLELRKLANQIEEGNYGTDDNAFLDPDDLNGFLQDIEDDIIGKIIG